MNQKYTVLYARLSKDDAGENEVSNSIVNQRNLLTDFAERSGLTPYVILQEDCEIIEPNPGSPINTGFPRDLVNFYHMSRG